MNIIHKNIFLLLFLLVLSNCGFKVLHQNAGNNFNIKEVYSSGDKKINYKIKNNLIVSNSLTGVLLNIFMFIGIFSSIKFYDNSKILILILMINITIYITGYYYLLFKKRDLNRNKKTIKKTDNKTDVISK